MASLTVLYTAPAENADAFIEEYKKDHLAIAERFPKMASMNTTVFSGTPRGGDPAFLLMFHGTWASQEDFNEALTSPVLMEASGHAMQMLGKYGNSAEMLLGD